MWLSKSFKNQTRAKRRHWLFGSKQSITTKKAIISFYLAQKTEESAINDYNATLLLANQANVDVQDIAHKGSRLPYYITNYQYVINNEWLEQDDMWHDRHNQKSGIKCNVTNTVMFSRSLLLCSQMTLLLHLPCCADTWVWLFNTDESKGCCGSTVSDHCSSRCSRTTLSCVW